MMGDGLERKESKCGDMCMKAYKGFTKQASISRSWMWPKVSWDEITLIIKKKEKSVENIKLVICFICFNTSPAGKRSGEVLEAQLLCNSIGLFWP